MSLWRLEENADSSCASCIRWDNCQLLNRQISVIQTEHRVYIRPMIRPQNSHTEKFTSIMLDHRHWSFLKFYGTSIQWFHLIAWVPDLPVTPSSGPDVYAPPWHRYPASQGPLISRRPGVSQYLPLSHWVQLSTCSKSTVCQTNHHNIVRQRTPDFMRR